jgi:hypothetical protein
MHDEELMILEIIPDMSGLISPKKRFNVACSCGAQGPHADTREEASENWNYRVHNSYVSCLLENVENRIIWINSESMCEDDKNRLSAAIFFINEAKAELGNDNDTELD